MTVVTPTVSSEGKELGPAVEVLSIDVSRELNRIPSADLLLVDGSAVTRTYEVSDSDFFEPGKEIEIKLRYEGEDDETVFKGVAVRQTVTANAAGSTLEVAMKDAAVKLTGARKSAVFRDRTDGEVIGDLLAGAGLEKGVIAATRPKHKELVQYSATDWDFILSRAEVSGLVVLVVDGEVTAAEVALSGSPKHTFEWGISEIYDFELEADAGRQFDAFESVAWSPKDLKLTPAKKARAFATEQGNLDAGKLARALGFTTRTLSHPVALDDAELQAWADARMMRSRMAMLRGRIAVKGFARVLPLDLMEVAGIGERWNGKTLVTGVRHRVDASGWRTDLQFGLSPEWFCRREDVAECRAAGLLPPVAGLQIGVVGAFEDDPEKEYRARVVLPGVEEKDRGVWARLLSPEAGKERGWFFRPEAGDEVVVGFLNDDPRQPIVLGSLFGSKNRPPAGLSELTAGNPGKGIVTRRGTLFLFDDDKGSVTIETPKKRKVLLDDDGETITLSDPHSNSVTLSADGVEIKSAKNVVLDAGGNVEIKGKKVDVK